MPETLQACEVVQSATQDELNLAREVCGQNCILCQANSTQNDTPAVERAEVARPVRHTRPREPQIVCDATVIPNTGTTLLSYRDLANRDYQRETLLINDKVVELYDQSVLKQLYEVLKVRFEGENNVRRD